jgi:hypothetical protein
LRLNRTNLLDRVVVAFSESTHLAAGLLHLNLVFHQDSQMTLPYARPKVGRRASDRKLLDEWYAHHAGPDRAGDLRAVAPLRPHPARAADSTPRPERRAVPAASPAIS